MSLRKGRIPGTALGPSRRIVGITIISFLAMMFTPTKWTHHFGVFAGLAGSLGALAAVAVTAAAMKSRRNRAMFAAAVLFVMALSFATRQRLVVRLQLRCAMVECQFPEWHFGFTTFLLGLARSSPCWWRRGSTSPAATARRPTRRRRWQRIIQTPVGDCRVGAGRCSKCCR